MSYRFALLGCGNIASRHALQAKAVGVLAAVCDIVPGRAASFAERYGARPYSSLDNMLKEEAIDIVTVATPNGLHAQHAVRALEAGCHVLCEKPLAITSADGLRMLQAAKAAGKRLFVVKQNRYNAPVAAVKNLIDAGKLGKVNGFVLNCFWNRPAAYYNESWRGTLALDGGTLFTQFSHFIDLLWWFLGDMDTTTGWRSNCMHRGLIEFEDIGVACIVMKNGAVGTVNYTINAHLKNMEGSFTLFGDRGTVKIGGRYLNTIEHFSVENEPLPQLQTSGPANTYGFYEGSMSNHETVYRHLIKALDSPAHAFVEASEGLKSVEMIERIYAASPFVHNPMV
jgi:predicted dehydrogenase